MLKAHRRPRRARSLPATSGRFSGGQPRERRDRVPPHVCDAAVAGAPVLAPLVGSLVTYDGGGEAAAFGGGFLLQCVGAPAGAGSLRACNAAFAVLASPHAEGVHHGDARLPNLLDLGGVLRWIDLQGGPLSATCGRPPSSPPCSAMMPTPSHALCSAARRWMCCSPHPSLRPYAAASQPTAPPLNRLGARHGGVGRGPRAAEGLRVGMGGPGRVEGGGRPEPL